MAGQNSYRFQFKIDYLERILIDQISLLKEINQNVNHYDEQLQNQICQYNSQAFQLRNIHKHFEVPGTRFEVEHLNHISNQTLALKTAMAITLNRIEFYRKKKLNLLMTQNRQREKVSSIFKTIKKFESHKDSLSEKKQGELKRTEQKIEAESQLFYQLKDG